MRSLRLAFLLARRSLRRRPGQALLLLLTLTIATGVLGVATSLLGSADAPWDRVWRATNGFHVSLTVYHPPDEPGTAPWWRRCAAAPPSSPRRRR